LRRYNTGVEADDALIAAVLQRSAHEYMLAHSSQFDEHWITSQQALTGRWGIDGRPATATPKVTPNGTHGAHAAALSADTEVGPCSLTLGSLN